MPSDPSGHYRFGRTEWEDVETAVCHARGKSASDVLLVGYSTGAAHILAFMERLESARHVKALVLDPPNLILAETVRHGSRELRVAGLGIRVNRLLIELGMRIADLRWDIDWDQTNYVERAHSTIGVPTLVFHGTSGRIVPVTVSRRLAAASPGLVQLQETLAAGHVVSWNADPELYETLLDGFLSELQN